MKRGLSVSPFRLANWHPASHFNRTIWRTMLAYDTGTNRFGKCPSIDERTDYGRN